MKVRVIYDFADEWPRLYPFILFAISLFCLFYFGRVIRKYRRNSIPYIRLFNDRSFIGFTLAGFFCFFVGYLALNLPDYMHAKTIYQTGRYKQAFGYVSHVNESHRSKCNELSFELNGLSFTFADCYSLYGCSYDLASRSGIGDSSLVRVYYTDDNKDNMVLRNRVLRLEIFNR